MTHHKEIREGNAAAIRGQTVLKALGIWLGASLLCCVAAGVMIAQTAPAWHGTDIPTLIYVDVVYAALPVGLWAALDGRQRIPRGLAFRFASMGELARAVGVWGLIVATVALLYGGASFFTVPVSTLGLNILEKGTDMARMPSATPLAWVLIGIRVFFLARLAEELLFRRLLYGWIASRWSPPVAVVATALLFGTEHAYPVLIPIGVIYGLGAGWIRWNTGSTFNTWVMHVLTDGVMFWAAFWIAMGHLRGG
jgi:membrane protease YdiL (CAAX protease family)